MNRVFAMKDIIVIVFMIIELCSSNIKAAALVYASAPAGSQDQVIKLAKAFEREAPEFLDGALPSNVSISQPFPCYQFTAANLADKECLLQATASSWRYPITGKDTIVAIVEMRIIDSARNALKFYALYQRPQIDYITKSLLVAAEVTKESHSDMELRYISINSAFSGFWLHSDRSDLIIPFPMLFARFIPYRVYSNVQMSSFLSKKE